MPRILWWALALGSLLTTPVMAQTGSANDLGTQPLRRDISDLAGPRDLQRGEFNLGNQGAGNCPAAPDSIRTSTAGNPQSSSNAPNCVQVPIGPNAPPLLIRGQSGSGDTGGAVLVPIR